MLIFFYRIKRKVTKDAPLNLSTIDFRFPTEKLRLKFATTFVPMHNKYLSRSLFNNFCHPTVELFVIMNLVNWFIVPILLI